MYREYLTRNERVSLSSYSLVSLFHSLVFLSDLQWATISDHERVRYILLTCLSIGRAHCRSPLYLTRLSFYLTCNEPQLATIRESDRNSPPDSFVSLSDLLIVVSLSVSFYLTRLSPYPTRSLPLASTLPPPASTHSHPTRCVFLSHSLVSLSDVLIAARLSI